MENKYTYIAIDDNEDALKGIENAMLESSLFRCSGVFSDFLEAISFLEKKSVDLLLCDIELSNGIISYKHLDQLPPTLPVIFVTGQINQVAQACFKAVSHKNVISCMCKPFTQASMSEVEGLYQSYLNLGIELATQKFRNEKTFLECSRYKDEVNAPEIRINLPAIIMIKPCDEVHGCEVYSLKASKPLYIKRRSLEDIYTQLNRDYSNTFILVKRKGIVHCGNVQYMNNRFLVKDITDGINAYWCKNVAIEVPRRQKKEIDNLFVRYTKK